MNETQQSITEWGDTVFGVRNANNLQALVARANLEMAELVTQVARPCNNEEIRNECADILVMLYTIAGVLEFDLQNALDSKMAINRLRQWKLNGDGTGRHV